jgi:hypothetical protein
MRWRPRFWRVLRIHCHVPSWASQLQSLAVCCVSLRVFRRNKWPAWTTAAEFWTVLRIHCHVSSWASQLQSLAVRSLSLSLRVVRRNKWPAWTTAAEFWMILRIHCHLPSWACQLQSLAVRSLSVCMRATPSVLPVIIMAWIYPASYTQLLPGSPAGIKLTAVQLYNNLWDFSFSWPRVWTW